jgi:hypothetical protein
MRRLLLALAVALTLAPAPAAADFHLVSLREVFPGDAASPEAEYVELQAYAAGQNFVSGHSVTFYDTSGTTIATESFSNDVANGGNQMTFVMATAAAESRFGFAADEGMKPNLIDPAGGAICWAALDCVAWGSFGGSLPSPAGAPAAPAGIPDGMALRRTIAPGCATLLEPADDRDDSALDFFAVFPAPRPNSSPPPEHDCEGSPGPGGGPNGAGAPGTPQTKLRKRPPQRTSDRTPTFRFASDEEGVSFECRLDRKPFRACRSPFTTRRLSLGPHAFRVRAHDASGLADPTPVLDTFRVVRGPR